MNQRIIVFLCAMLALTPISALSTAEINSPAPNCTVTPIGETLRQELRQFRGKVVYVDFWASWCGPCAQSFPFLNELDRDLRDRGLHIVGINVDENIEDAKGFLAKTPARFDIVTDASGQCPQDFGVQAMPSSYLIDRQGVIRHVHLGFRPGDTAQLRGLVEELLKESPAGHP